jgi:Bacteriophage Mu, Gp27
MPARGKIKALPAKLRAELDRRLVDGNFSNYRGLARWLGEHGCEISHGGLEKYGRQLERRLATLRLATEQARAVVKAAGGADDTVNEGLMRLVQGDLFNVLLEVREIDPKKANLGALARHVASICRSAVQMRRLAEEMRSGIGKRVKKAERKVVAAARRGAAGGLSSEAERRIRAALLEIAELPAPLVDESLPSALRPAAEREGNPVHGAEVINHADDESGSEAEFANDTE